jgi:hypothetical protein
MHNETTALCSQLQLKVTSVPAISSSSVTNLPLISHTLLLLLLLLLLIKAAMCWNISASTVSTSGANPIATVTAPVAAGSRVIALLL